MSAPLPFTIDPDPAFGEYNPNTENLFLEFSSKLYARLVQLGFIVLPEPKEEKSNMGFVKDL